METEDEKINKCRQFVQNLKPYSPCTIKFDILPPTGSRFRYQSEIEHKSYSLLKTENKSPILKVFTKEYNSDLIVDVVTTQLSLHFHMLYEIPKDKLNECLIHDGKLCKRLEDPGLHSIKLDVGILKMKKQEAIARIKKLYPKINATSFFDSNKDTVILRATCYSNGIPACYIYSEIIKSQTSKENKQIKIRHIAPKVVAETGEQLIIVLEKKITIEDYEALITVDNNSYPLPEIVNDGQTFVFSIPNIFCSNTISGKFTMSCEGNSDWKPIKFLSNPIESIKNKKFENYTNDLPLQRVNNPEPQDTVILPLCPESRSGIDTTMKFVSDDYYDKNSNNKNYFGIHFDDLCHDALNAASIYDIEDETNEPLRMVNVSSLPKVDNYHLDTNTSSKYSKKILNEAKETEHDFR